MGRGLFETQTRSRVSTRVVRLLQTGVSGLMTHPSCIHWRLLANGLNSFGTSKAQMGFQPIKSPAKYLNCSPKWPPVKSSTALVDLLQFRTKTETKGQMRKSFIGRPEKNIRTFFVLYDFLFKRGKVKNCFAFWVVSFVYLMTFSSPIFASEPNLIVSSGSDNLKPPQNDLATTCFESLKRFKGYLPDADLKQACRAAQVSEGCHSVNSEPLFHIDTKGNAKNPKKILVFSLIHGDETGAGSMGRFWLERLNKISPRNEWRMIPVLNPDGVLKKTRTNSRGIDLNRNFPTSDWSTHAIDFWKTRVSASPRKFPGETPASEPEVQCALKHIKEFKPEFVVSIHTPLNVLDFDGPKKANIHGFDYLPWRRLGNFPGSLGRYLWVENNIPVLTAELKPTLPNSSQPFTELQDLIGHLTQKDLE